MNILFQSFFKKIFFVFMFVKKPNKAHKLGNIKERKYAEMTVRTT